MTFTKMALLPLAICLLLSLLTNVRGKHYLIQTKDNNKADFLQDYNKNEDYNAECHRRVGSDHTNWWNLNRTETRTWQECAGRCFTYLGPWTACTNWSFGPEGRCILKMGDPSNFIVNYGEGWLSGNRACGAPRKG